jgi:hypothetical protein
MVNVLTSNATTKFLVPAFVKIEHNKFYQGLDHPYNITLSLNTMTKYPLRENILKQTK